MAFDLNRKYASKIIKAGALLPDTKIMLAEWDPSSSVTENLQRFRTENVFGKASRSRVEDILPVFRQRYLTDADTIKALVALVNSRFPAEALQRILYFHSAQSDALLHDTVLDVLLPLRTLGRSEVRVDDIQRALFRWVDEGKTVGQWTESTVLRIAQGLLSTLRDFGVLEGSVNKRFAPMFLPVEAFAYVAFCLKRNQASGHRLMDDAEWGLFFLSRGAVERFFLEAHQRRLLEYHAAGSVVRITFPAESLEEYVNVILGRAY
jgi:hypothetical protein